jgi:transposase InsO family protein
MTSRWRFISEHRAEFGVKRLCRVLQVRRQGFYEWLAGEAARAERAAAEQELAEQIGAIHREHRGAYGSPRVATELRRRGRPVNRKRVERIMRHRGIVGITRRRRRSLTKQDTAAAPAEVVGHAMAEHMRAGLVCEAIELACRRGLVDPDAIFHSDRGSQYTSAEFTATLKRLRVRGSMGRVGSCYDNSPAESWFATCKAEIGTRVWETREQARQAVFTYLTYYNHQRLHSTLKYRTPYETRVMYRQDTALAA